MDALIGPQVIGPLLRLLAAVLVLVLVIVRLRGAARSIGVVGAMLIGLGSLQPAVYPLAASLIGPTGVPPIVPLVIINLIGALVLGVGVLMLALAIATASRRPMAA